MMDDNRVIKLLWVCAAALVVIGLFMTVDSLVDISEASMRLNRKAKEYAELKSLQDKIGRYHSAMQKFEDLQERQLLQIKDLVQKECPGQNADDVREIRSDSVEGWINHEAEVVLKSVSYANSMNLVYALEQLRPPWVLRKCVITASSQVSAGNVVLTFNGLSRK